MIKVINDDEFCAVSFLTDYMYIPEDQRVNKSGRSRSLDTLISI